MSPLDFLRYHVYRAKYVYGRSLPLRAPVDVSLELSSACNMACTYCYHGDKKNLPFTIGVMSLDTAIRIIDSAAAAGVNSLKFNYRGESTMNPNFERITAHARDLARGSTFIERITNSNFKFDSDRVDIFRGLWNQTKVKVSFDSFDPKVFEAQRKGGVHAVTFRNIDIFHDRVLDPKRQSLVIQMVRTKANASENFVEKVKRRWPLAQVSVRDMVAGRVGNDLKDLEAKTRDASDRQSCIQAHVRLMFDYQGKAGVCCPDIKGKIKVGDIHENTVLEIFNSAQARAIRAALKSKKMFSVDPCKTCSSFESHKGFSANWNS